MTAARRGWLARHGRELPPAAALAAVLAGVLLVAPSFFGAENLRDLAINNAPVLLVALGMTLVILTGEIDISVGSMFAVCSVAAGLLAKAGLPIALVPIAVAVVGLALGTVNGVLVGTLGLPSIIVTLAMLVAWRDALRWATQGAWVQDLPADFQWFGIGPAAAQVIIVGVPLLVLAATGWALRNLQIGRRLYAVGSDDEAARLAGIEPRRVVFGAFAATGALVGLAASLNAVRFAAVPSNAGLGLELQAVAAVVVGGAAITGGRGTVTGTLIGVLLLGTIGTAMTYVGISPYWAKAIQGLIILAALVADAALARIERHGGLLGRGAVAAR
ncbi:MAG TPA: ABC transporter permease [Gemmatimonadaceae bacterium]|jgi:rhamnose transport system permease protein|nr:ABC transporter permease [Gemmatimonadaceae bacterium]